jgi:hypothetical protein
MNKKAEIGDIMMSPVVHLILMGVFLGMMLVFILNFSNGGAIWADYYAKEVVKVVDFSESGDEVWIDVQKATEIARKNDVAFRDVFKFDNVEDEVCVKLSPGKETCFYFFNDVDIVDVDLLEAESRVGKRGSLNLLYFRIQEGERGGRGR